jgi:DNA-directed RNA polymerase subunit RPC12/RpoP
LYCPKCGAQLPDDASFCYKCGTRTTLATGGESGQAAGSPTQPKSIIAPSGVTSIKCPNCGAPIAPKFGEMIITCQYCGSAVTLGTEGWSSIQKQTMLPLKLATVDDLNGLIRPMMDKGLLHRHLQEASTQEEMSLSYVPYWIVSVSARTSIVATSEAQAIGQTATTAALMGVILGGMGGGFGGRRRAFWDTRIVNELFSGSFALKPIMMFGYGMYGGGMPTKSEQMDENYSFPVVALKALTAYQPRDYQFDLSQRTLFDITKIPKDIHVLNGDISEDVAKAQAKTLVDQLQSEKAHAKYHMIQRIYTESDVGDVELLHAPIWFAKFDHKGNKIVLVVDASSGRLINSMGL